MTSIHLASRRSSSRRSTLEAAQAAAISLALDDCDDDESINSTFIQDQGTELEKKSPAARLSVITAPREQGGQSQCVPASSNTTDEEISLQWSRAQAIASALNYLDSDDDSLESSANRKATIKVDDIFTQMHREGVNPNTCKSKTKFTVTRRLPPSVFSLDSTEKHRRRHSAPTEYSSIQQRPSIKYSQEGKAPQRVVARRRTLQSLELDVEENVLSERKETQCNDEEQRSVGNEELDVQEGQAVDDNTNTESQNSCIAAATPRPYKLYFTCLVIALIITMTAVVTVITFKPQDAEEHSDSTISEDTADSSIEVPELICTEQVPGEGWGGIACGPQAQGSGVCILAARAFLDQIQDADIALQNSRYCPVNIEKGTFSVNLAHMTFRSNLQLMTLKVSGEAIRLALFQGIKDVIERLERNEIADYPEFAGLRFSVNASSPTEQVFDIEVNERLEGEWRPLDPDDMFTIVSNSNMFNGQVEGLTGFSSIQSTPKETGKWSTQTFLDYATKIGELLPPKPEDYSTQVYIS